MTLFDPADAEAPAGPVVRVKAVVAYDGTGFSGFAAQRNGVKTIGGALADAIGRVLGHHVDITCAGRTDAGVHAWGQVISFDAAADKLDVEGLQRSINKQLRPQIALRSVEVADPEFDARFSATARRYRYRILNAVAPSPFEARTAWHVEWPLDVAALRLACDPLIGEHDFSAFCRRPKTTNAQEVSLHRRVVDTRWEVEGQMLTFWIEANAFCHQMVRSIVGTLVDVGVGKKNAADVTEIIRGGDRSAAGNLAPAHGLCLWEVRYAG